MPEGRDTAAGGHTATANSTTDQPTLAVTEADREAAAKLRQHMCGSAPGGRPLPSVAAILAGKWDDRETVQAFARHRTNSEPRPAGDLREALGKLSFAAYDYAGNYLLDERDDPELWWDSNHGQRILALFEAIEAAEEALATKLELALFEPAAAHPSTQGV